MDNCTIYSHNLDFDRVLDILQEHLPKGKIEYNDGGKQKSILATVKLGFFGKKTTLKINYRERHNPSYKLDNIECGLTHNLSGMVNYIQSLPADHETVRNKFLYKVKAANIEMAFIAEPYITDVFEVILKQIVADLDAFVFAQPSNFFQNSTEQHFLDNQLNLILDTKGNCNIQDIDVVIDSKYHDQSVSEYSNEQVIRRAKSEDLLTSYGIKTNSNLPCLAEAGQTELRSKQEIIARAYALVIVAAKGEGVPSANLKKPIEDKLITSFTSREQAIIDQENLNDQQKAYATWRYESLYTLLWASNLMPDLKHPSEICDVQTLVGIMLKTSREELEQEATLRSVSEITDTLDSIYRMHWACVDARIKGEQVSGSINPSIIYERHYALNWLTKYQDQTWDDVQTNT